MSVRDTLVQQIRDVVGTTVHVIEYEDNKDEIDRVTIEVKQRRIAPLPEAPIGALRVEYILTVTAPNVDPSKAEPTLDDFVPSFLDDMRPAAWFGWDEANKTIDGQNLAYDITAFVIASPTGD